MLALSRGFCLAKRLELFRIKTFCRRFDRASGKFVVNISYETAAPSPTPRTIAVAEGFGLGLDRWEKFVVYDNVELKISPRDIVYITGDSGSGKSVLLKALEKDIRKDLKLSLVNVSEVRVDPSKPLIETVGKNVEEAMMLLSKVGLGDAFLFLRSFNQLSDGQKYRYKIAKMIESKAQFWILDEFAATLDRDTAKIVAWNLQKLAREMGKCVLAATTHVDLLLDLAPNVYIHKRFGKEINVFYAVHEKRPTCSLIREMKVKEGTTKDWRELAGFHYRSHRIGPPRKIFVLKRGEELCGVIVFCYPPPACFGRGLVLPKMTMKELNQKLSIISRVVVHPKYRTVGLGVKLVRETLGLAGTECVEMSAVMAKYNPFAEKAGMKRVALQEPADKIVRLSRVLEELGFNIQLLGSSGYVHAKLKTLSAADVSRLKSAFVTYCVARIRKELVGNMPFGTQAELKCLVAAAGTDVLANLVRVVGLLLQTKVYLFWRKA